MLRPSVLGILVTLAIAVAMAVPDAASAATKKAKRISYEEAWQRCLAYVDQHYPRSTEGAERQRAAQGIACLQRYGYRP